MSLRLSVSPEVADAPPSPTRRGFAALFALIALITTGIAASYAPPNGHFEKTPEAVSGNITPVVAFADATRGYTLAPLCLAGQTSICHWRLWTTATGGTNWRGFPTPLPPVNSQSIPRLATVGQQGVLLEHQDQRWFSPNYGRSWEHQESRPTQRRDWLPEGSIARLACTNGTCRVEATLPAGTFATLHAALPIKEADGSWHRFEDGKLVLVGWDDENKPTIAASTNGGRQWETLTGPDSFAPPHNVSLEQESNETMVVTVHGNVGGTGARAGSNLASVVYRVTPQGWELL